MLMPFTTRCILVPSWERDSELSVNGQRERVGATPLSGKAQDGTSTRPIRRRDIVGAVNRCLIIMYECDRKQPVPERLTQLLAELGMCEGGDLVASKRRAADDD